MQDALIQSPDAALSQIRHETETLVGSHPSALSQRVETFDQAHATPLGQQGAAAGSLGGATKPMVNEVHEAGSSDRWEPTLELEAVTAEHGVDSSPLRPDLPRRYEARALLGRGGMGEVWRVYDRSLHRFAALKLITSPQVDSDEAYSRFLAEAQATAQLQHPGIVPVYDMGRLEDGRPYYVMKEIQGRSLVQAIEDYYRCDVGSDGTSPRAVPTALLEVFLRVCEAVGYAHDRGVVHRDLKPSNIMLGRHGEVFVVDWGLVRLQSGIRQEGKHLEPGVFTVRSGTGEQTSPGRVAGTVRYMAPEQARGLLHQMGPWSDVFSLGAILYEILSGHPLYDGANDAALLLRVMNAEWRWQKSWWSASEPTLVCAQDKLETVSDSPDQAQDWADPPASLEGPVDRAEWDPSQGGLRVIPAEGQVLVEACLQRDPRARPANAEQLAAEVQAWLLRSNKREKGLEALARLEGVPQRIQQLETEAHQRRAQAMAQREGVAAWEPVERKRPVWALEDEATRLDQEALRERVAYLQGLQGVLTLDPTLEEAHQRLADYHQAVHQAAEREGRSEEAAQAAQSLRHHDRSGRYATYLKGVGALTLVTEPTNVDATLWRYELEDRRLVATFVRSLGRPPFRALSLPMGSYLIQLTSPGRATVRYPVRLARGEHWDGVPPGAREPRAVYLPHRSALGPEDCYVPAGWFWCGTPDRGQAGLPRKRVWLESFVMRKFPTRVGEYLEFVNALVGQVDEDVLLSLVPRMQAGLQGEEGAMVFARQPAGSFSLGVDSDGDRWHPEEAVSLVNYACAVAYCAWYGQRTGLPWRLPDELEWEKSARGVDERIYPFGNFLDPSFACMRDSHPGRPATPPVESYPLDESVYGVRGLAGNIMDLCAGEYLPEGPSLNAVVPDQGLEESASAFWSVVRGGSIDASARGCRAVDRLRVVRTRRHVLQGFRLARSLDHSDRLVVA